MSITIIIFCFLFAIAYWYIQPASPKLAFATSNRGRGRHPKYDVVLAIKAAAPVIRDNGPAGGFTQPKRPMDMTNADKVIQVIRLDVVANRGHIDYTWTNLDEPVWKKSLADYLCPDYIKIDLKALKSLDESYKPRIVDMLQRMIEDGISVGGRKYYVSGSTQSTKSGVLYAYAVKYYWLQNGFSRIKDCVRGGALHAPCYYGVKLDQHVHLTLINDKNTRIRVEDGQMACGYELFHILISTDPAKIGRKVRYQQPPQVRAVPSAMGPDLYLLKGIVRYDPWLAPMELAVRTDDVKGDGKVKLTDHQDVVLSIGILDKARPLTMDYSHQSLSFNDDSVFDAIRLEREKIAAHFNASSNPEKLAHMAGDIRTAKGVDRMALLGKAARFCQDVGNDLLLRSRAINTMMQDTFASWALHASLGNMTTAYLTATYDRRVPADEIHVNPIDYEKIKALYEQECGKGGFTAFNSGDLVRVVRMPAQNSGVAIKCILNPRVSPGAVWCNPTSFKSIGQDYDGDRIGILFPKSIIEDAVISLPNPPVADTTGRADGAVPQTLAEAIYAQLMMNVGWPFAILQRLITLTKIMPEYEPYYELVKDDLLWQGQLGVDNAKHFGVHDSEFLKSISDQIREYGLTKAHMAWYKLCRPGDVRGWMPLGDSAKRMAALGEDNMPVILIDGKLPRLTPEGELVNPTGKRSVMFDDGTRWMNELKDDEIIPLDYTLKTVVDPSELCDGLSPISESLRWFGEHLIMPRDRMMPNGIFQTRMPDGEGEGAQAASKFVAQANAEFKRISEIGDGDEKQDAEKAFGTRIDEVYASLQKAPPDYFRNFLLRVWNLQFQGESGQRLLWRLAPDEIFDLLYEFKDLWQVDGDAPYWMGRTFGALIPEGAYTARCEITDDNPKPNWHFTHIDPTNSDVQEYWAVGMDGNPPFDHTGEYTAFVKPTGKGKVCSVQILPQFSGVKNKTEKISSMLLKAGYKPTRQADGHWVFGGLFRADAGGTIWERLQISTGGGWQFCSEQFVRASVANKLDSVKVVRWIERNAKRRQHWDEMTDLAIDPSVDDVPDMSDCVVIAEPEMTVA